ncbi:MAG: hypothetical protein H6Q71_1730 [Firmicutes bacterium]|nr:hypothetical protein [Bacillota bacterium]
MSEKCTICGEEILIYKKDKPICLNCDEYELTEEATRNTKTD